MKIGHPKLSRDIKVEENRARKGLQTTARISDQNLEKNT